MLQTVILRHIFAAFGVLGEKTHTLLPYLLHADFLLEKQLAFEVDGEKYQRNVFAAAVNVNSSEIKILVAETTDEISDFTIILQMDNSIPYALRLSADEEDDGAIMFCAKDNNWIAAGTLPQAKLLVGVESLAELFLEWKKLDHYQDLYKTLIGYLNFEEQRLEQ